MSSAGQAVHATVHSHHAKLMQLLPIHVCCRSRAMPLHARVYPLIVTRYGLLWFPQGNVQTKQFRAFYHLSHFLQDTRCLQLEIHSSLRPCDGKHLLLAIRRDLSGPVAVRRTMQSHLAFLILLDIRPIDSVVEDLASFLHHKTVSKNIPLDL